MNICSYLYTIYLIETDDPEEACGDNCLNRILMIEWFGCLNTFFFTFS